VPDRPALAPWCRLVEDGPRVLLEHGGTVVTLEGRAATALMPRLLPLLDGTRTTDEIVNVIGIAARPAVTKALSLLADNQLLVEGPLAPSDGDASIEAATFAVSLVGYATQASARERLAAGQVMVVGSGAMAAEIRRLVHESGVPEVDAIPIEETMPNVSLVVAAPAADELRALDGVNARALERDQPWLQALPYDGRFVVAGPLFVPQVSACRSCWITRRAACSGYEEDFELVEQLPLHAPAPAPVVALGAGLAALLAIRWLTTADPAVPGGYYSLEPRSIARLRFDRLLRVPRCVACGPMPRGVPSPWFELAR
jgi:bacteriocin biosynthesis cyclodehydratase domain-containing protein